MVQLNQQIYYKTSKPISEGGELKVRIGEDYAATLCLGESAVAEAGPGLVPLQRRGLDGWMDLCLSPRGGIPLPQYSSSGRHRI